jgi:predicted dehydrogenase
MPKQLTRRDTFHLAGAAALAGVSVPLVHAGGSETLGLALVGCGGRGTGAVENALSAQYGPAKLLAMADVFQGKLDSSYQSLSGGFKEKVDVPPERRFIGFDGYKKAMDALKPGDVVILATPPAFRWVQFKYAIEKGLNVFMEKPIAVDGPTCRKMFQLGEEATKKNLKVAIGLMCRHCRSRGELFQRIKDGQLGQITMLRCYRQHGPQATCFSGPRPANVNELDYQIQRFHSFLWASGGSYSDFYIHNIDECCWMKDAWPVEARGSGGRHYRGNNIDQNFDSYSVEYTFADGSKLFMEGRNIAGCDQEFASYAHGTKGAAVISQSGHAPSKCRIYPDQNLKGTPTWKCPTPEPDPYQTEWDDLFEAIRKDTPYNETKRGTEASLVTAMGRMAAHTGQVVRYSDMLNCEHEFAPDVDKLVLGGPAPLVAGPDGKYPVPEPGKKKKREY